MSAPGMDKCDDKHPASTRGEALYWIERKIPWETGAVEVQAEQRIMNEGLDLEVYERREYGDRLLY